MTSTEKKVAGSAAAVAAVIGAFALFAPKSSTVAAPQMAATAVADVKADSMVSCVYRQDATAQCLTMRAASTVEPSPTPIDTVVTVDTTPPPAPGVRIGASGALTAGFRGPLNLSVDASTADNIVARLAQARALGYSVITNMTGGAHSNYKTGGKFDVAKWRARMNAYKTPAIQKAVSAAVADGTIIGNSVMDEPQQVGTDEKAWWPDASHMTKAVIDGLCGYVKGIFPTLPVGVTHDVAKFDPSHNYATCDFVVSQYRASKGTPQAFAKEAHDFGVRSHVAIVLSMNYLDGGKKVANCPSYGSTANEAGVTCPMTQAEIVSVGKVFLDAGVCAISGWRFDDQYHDRADVKAGIGTLATLGKGKPGITCRRKA